MNEETAGRIIHLLEQIESHLFQIVFELDRQQREQRREKQLHQSNTPPSEDTP